MQTDKKAKFLHSRSIFSFIILLEIVTAGFVINANYKSYKASYEKEVEYKFEKAANIIYAKVDTYVRGLKSVSSVYLTKNFEISNRELRKYAEFRDLFNRFEGVLGIGFIRYVKADELSNYIQNVRKGSGTKDFSIKKLSEIKYPDLMVIEAIEPFERNQLALGLDVGSEEKRRKAATLAMETGLPVITESIHLVQEDPNEIGFLLFHPLYEDGKTPATLEERRKKIKGWTYSPVTEKGAKEYFIKHIDPSIKFELFSEGSDGVWNKVAGNSSLPTHQFEKKINFGERQWLLRANYERKGFEFNLEILSILGFFFLTGVLLTITIAARTLLLSNDSTKKRALIAENWISTVVNSSHFCIFSTDKNGLINTVNKSAEEALGYSEKELQSRFFSCVILNNINELISRAQTTGLEMLETEVTRRDGVRFPVRMVITPVFGDQKSLQGFLIVLEDLTEVVKMREELNVKQQQIIAASRLSSLGEMAAGLAHEINNPLSIISSKVLITLEKVKRNKHDDKFLVDSLSKIDETVFRIARLVRGLKTLSRDATADPMVPSSLFEIMNDSVGLCSEKLKSHGVLLKVNASKDFIVDCRPSQLNQVFINLITNALDAIEESEEKWITVNIEYLQNKAKIKVIDSGKGIKFDIAEKILDPFFTTKETGRGTGLGLSISKTIITEHKGSLYYDSTAENTTFVIELPLHREVTRFVQTH